MFLETFGWISKCKQIQPVHPKGNQSWIFIGRTDAEAETLATWCEELTHWKRSWCWERLKARGEVDDRGWDGWMASPTQWSWVWVNSGIGDRQGGVACCSPWGSQRVRQDWVTELRLRLKSSLTFTRKLMIISTSWIQKEMFNKL